MLFWFLLQYLDCKIETQAYFMSEIGMKGVCKIYLPRVGVWKNFKFDGFIMVEQSETVDFMRGLREKDFTMIGDKINFGFDL